MKRIQINKTLMLVIFTILFVILSTLQNSHKLKNISTIYEYIGNKESLQRYYTILHACDCKNVQTLQAN